MSESSAVIDILNERNAALTARLLVAEGLLREWTTPINWEDGSADVEGRIIEGQQHLLASTGAYLASPAPEAELREALRQAYEALMALLVPAGERWSELDTNGRRALAALKPYVSEVRS